MFDQIAPTYDRANRFITFGLDRYWRSSMCRFLPPTPGLTLLDCATGTGDQILALIKHSPRIIQVVGIDLAEEMLAIGKQKIAQAGYDSMVELQVGSAMSIPFPDHYFDCVTISFGIRNVMDVRAALKECYRVLKPGGRLLILEGTIPSNSLLRTMHRFYLRYALPRLGKWISRHPSAYRYLNETIETFPHGNAFLALMKQAQFSNVIAHSLTGGIATIYQGEKAS